LNIHVIEKKQLYKKQYGNCYFIAIAAQSEDT